METPERGAVITAHGRDWVAIDADPDLGVVLADPLMTDEEKTRISRAAAMADMVLEKGKAPMPVPLFTERRSLLEIADCQGTA